MNPQQQTFAANTFGDIGKSGADPLGLTPISRNRRLAWLLAGATLFCGVLAADITEAAPQPNIVLILADDLDATTSEYWERATNVGKDDPLKKTRALLRDKGMTFTNAFAPTPICCPARSTLLTGKLGHNTGVLTNGGDQGGWGAFVRNGGENNNVAVWLNNAGYRTGLIGKYLNGIDQAPTHVPPGWSDWHGFVDPRLGEYIGYGYDVNENGRIVHYGWNENDYSTDVVARKSVEFINAAEANDAQPFFLYVSPTAPHLPLAPAPRHANHPYKNAIPPQAPNFQEADLSDKSLWLRASGDIRKKETALWNPVDYRNRQGSLYALDDLVESVVNTLAARGELDNTYIVFISDNGYNLGAHRLIHKMAPYEESIRVPMVIRGPGVAAGSTRAQMVLETDLAPTFAQWAGLAVPADVDGRTLKPLLGTSAPATWRSDFLLQYVGSGAANGIGAELPPAMWYLSGMEIPTYRALREGRYKLVEFYGSPDFPNVHEYELYDLQNDKYEMKNLIATPMGKVTWANKVLQMKSRMDALTLCAGANCR